MDINQFLHERRPRWQRLSQLLDQVDSRGLANLPPRQVSELFSLYRLVSSDLNLVQTRTANPTLLEYLEALVGRAYANLAVPRQANFFTAWWRILRHYFPATIRREWRLLALAAAVLVAGGALGFAVTWVHPERADIFLYAFKEHLSQSPRDRVAEAEQAERQGKPRVDSLDTHAVFSTFLFTHNIQVMSLGFALGLTYGLGTMCMLFSTGTMIGSLAALYARDGVMTFFIAWVGPHGSIEIPCVIFGCTAGLMLARAMFRGDQGSFMSQLRRMRPALVDILVGAATLLVLAGIIEGGFSQINEPTLPYVLKIAVAIVLFSLLVGYIFLLPAKPRPRSEDEA